MHSCFTHCKQESASSESSGQVEGAKKHEIYVAAFVGHLFYNLFLQDQGGHGPLGPPLDPLLPALHLLSVVSGTQCYVILLIVSGTQDSCTIFFGGTQYSIFYAL